MSAIQSAIVQEIKDDPTLAGFVGDRIFPDIVPDTQLEANDNFITYSPIAERYVQDVAVIISTVQINCISKSLGDAESMHLALFNVLQRFKGELGSGSFVRDTKFAYAANKRQVFDEKTETYSIQADFVLKYQEE